MSADTDAKIGCRTLLVSGSEEEAEAIRALLGDDVVVVSATSLERAVQQIETGEAAGLVLGLGAARAIPRDSDRAFSSILQHLGQGVCVVSASGEIVWRNPALSSKPPEVAERAREACARCLAEWRASTPTAARATRLVIEVGRSTYFDVTITPDFEPGETPARAVAVLVDISAARRLQDQLNAIDAAGRELVQIDLESVSKLDTAERLRMLEEKIIAYSHDLLHFDHFLIRVLDRKSNRLDALVWDGLSEEAAALTIRAESEGNGISGHVAATGRSYICPDVRSDHRYLPGLENAGSTLTVPLKLHDQVVGVLNVESDRLAAFNEDDRQIAEIFARYVAIALHILQLLAVERFATTGQIAADVDAEIASPLNDIVARVARIMDDYRDDAGLCERLHVVMDGVDRVRDAIHAVTEPSGALVGVSPEAPPRDPVISHRRILIADDEDVIRETIGDVLAKHGATTVLAREGNEAIAILRAQKFDLVLSDIKMPNRNGYEVFSAARQLSQSCPVILMTGFGYDPNHSIVKASKEGLAGVLFKPFKVEQLLEEVRHALQGSPRA